jgi:hypothetical protein
MPASGSGETKLRRGSRGVHEAVWPEQYVDLDFKRLRCVLLLA